jgi:orotidine-5'-phosphate decarboxylase
MTDHASATTHHAARAVPDAIADRLIVALDLESVEAAWKTVRQLEGIVSFFKIGLWLQFAPGVDELIGGLIASGKKVFLDAKMYDIPETVSRAVAVAARRQVSFITVHGDEAILRAACKAREGSDLKIFAVTVLTSLDDAALHGLGYRLGAQDLVQLRAARAAACGCDGIIASAYDNPDGIRSLAGKADLLIATPGVRMEGDATHDHKRGATPSQAIENGADYLVIGRPIVQDADPAGKARRFVQEMEAGWRKRDGAGMQHRN